MTFRAPKNQDYRVYRGCVHIHSAYSDGGGTVEDIAGDAETAGLDFAIVTDHNTIQGLADGKEGWYGSSLILIGVEISLPAGHYMALNVPPDFTWNGRNTQQSMDMVAESGGFGILAHPTERWPWKDWSVTGFVGMEIANMSSLVHRESKARPARLVLNFLSDSLVKTQRAMAGVLSQPPEAGLSKWTEIMCRRKTVGIGGLDAHSAIKIGSNTLRIPAYSDLFKALQMHILVPEPFNHDLKHDKTLVYDAIRHGRCYTAYTFWGDAAEFAFTASRDGMSSTIGDSLAKAGRPVSLHVKVPGSSTTNCKVYRQEHLILATHRRSIDIIANHPGAYHVEVDKQVKGKFVPWIISNPIYIE
jgi:hypothetical protein